ncbi:MAG: hypothetical protein JWP75_3693 [Frondihabitans sp.]|nr:hypothetical protein [Frondihabitans sp.]
MPRSLTSPNAHAPLNTKITTDAIPVEGFGLRRIWTRSRERTLVTKDIVPGRVHSARESRKFPRIVFGSLLLASGPALLLVADYTVFWRLSDLSDARISVGPHASWTVLLAIPTSLAALVVGVIVITFAVADSREAVHNRIALRSRESPGTRFAGGTVVGLGAMGLLMLASICVDVVNERVIRPRVADYDHAILPILVAGVFASVVWLLPALVALIRHNRV